MAKRNQIPEQPSSTPMIVMVIGGVLVAGLVVWALTRTVEPAAVTPVTTESIPATPPSSATATLPTTTMPTATQPLQTATSGTTAPLTPSSFSIPPGGPQAAEKAEVARISAEDLRAQFDRGAVTIVDVRDAGSYASGHIPGALNIPFASIQGQIDVLPKGTPIVTYCT